MKTPEQIAEKEGRVGRRSDIQMMSKYLKLAKDLGISDEDFDVSRGALQQYRESTRGQGADYQRPDSLYSFLADPFETQRAADLAKVAQQYDDYNLRHLYKQNLGGGAQAVHGFNPRAVGNAVLDLNPNKFQRVDNMFDLIGEQWGKDVTKEDIEKYGHFKALNPKRFGENMYRLRVADDQGFSGGGDDYLKAFYRYDPNKQTYSLVPKEQSPFQKYYFKQPDKQGGFLGDLGPLAALASMIPGPQQPFVAALNAANSASAGNYAQALLSAAGISDIGGFSNPLYEFNPLNNLGPVKDAAGNLNWARIAGNAAANAGAAAIDGRDVLSSAASAFGPATGLPGPLGSMAIQYALNAARGRPNDGGQIAQNASQEPVQQPIQLPWWMQYRQQGTGMPAAPATPRYA